MGVVASLLLKAPLNSQAASGLEGEGKSPSTVHLPHQAWGTAIGGTQAWRGSSQGSWQPGNRKAGRTTPGVLSSRSASTQSSLEGFLEESITRESGAGASERK